MKAYIFFSNRNIKKKEKEYYYMLDRLKEKYEVIDSNYGSSIDGLFSSCENIEYYDLIIIYGGDGFTHGIINKLYNANIKANIALIPRGTCNDFAKSFNIPKNIKKCMDVILSDNIVNASLIKANDIICTYAMALGYMNEVSYNCPSKLKKVFGKLAYFIHVIPTFFKTKPVIINDKRYAYYLYLHTKRLINFKMNTYNEKLVKVEIPYKNKLISSIDFALFVISGGKYRHNINYSLIDNESIIINDSKKVNGDGELLGIFDTLDVALLNDYFKIFSK